MATRKRGTRAVAVPIAEALRRELDELYLKALDTRYNGIDDLPNGTYTIRFAYSDPGTVEATYRRIGSRKEYSDNIVVCFVLQEKGAAENQFLVVTERLDIEALELLREIKDRRISVQNSPDQKKIDGALDRGVLYNRLAKRDNEEERRRIWLFRHIGLDDLNELEAGRPYRIEGASEIKNGIIVVELIALRTEAREAFATRLFIHCYGNNETAQELLMYFTTNRLQAFTPKIRIPRLMSLPKMEDILSAIEVEGYIEQVV